MVLTLVTTEPTLVQPFQEPLDPQIWRPILYAHILKLFKSLSHLFFLNISPPLVSLWLLSGCQFLFRTPDGSLKPPL